MTITRVNSSGWPTNGTVTRAEINALDTNVTKALDRTSAGDSLQGRVLLTGAGRIASSVYSIPNAGGSVSYTIGNTNNVVRAHGSVTADVTLALSTTGALDGDLVSIYAETDFNYGLYVVQSGIPAPLYLLGNKSSHDGTWVQLIYFGSTWRVYQQAQGSRLRRDDITSTTTWTCPRGVSSVLIYAYGGGGHGGDGGSGSGSTSATGGSGGGGAVGIWATMATTAGSNYSVTVGRGGTAASDPHGQPSTIVLSGSTLVSAPGGYGGWNGFVYSSGFANRTPIPGMPVPYDYGSRMNTSISVDAYNSMLITAPGTGGIAGPPVVSNALAYSPTDGQANVSLNGTINTGGNAGSSFNYGGGGGGGGAGPGGPGGNGAWGSYVAGTAGSAGSSAAANSGAGGGGSGGSASGAAAINGGSGGSGKVVIFYVK